MRGLRDDKPSLKVLRHCHPSFALELAESLPPRAQPTLNSRGLWLVRWPGASIIKVARALAASLHSENGTAAAADGTGRDVFWWQLNLRSWTCIPTLHFPPHFTHKVCTCVCAPRHIMQTLDTSWSSITRYWPQGDTRKVELRPAVDARKTPHSAPVRVGYGAIFVFFFSKNICGVSSVPSTKVATSI